MAAIVGLFDTNPVLLAGIGLTDLARQLALTEAVRLAARPLPAPSLRHPDGPIAFLATAPLTDQSNRPVGALVVMDHRRRAASPRNRQALSDLATVVSLSLMMHQSLEQLELLAITDPLTGLYNRRGLDLLFARHAHAPMALLAADIDDFKAFNDAHGHSAGDAMLAHVATCLRQSVRVSDGIARTGGDEFIILLPDTSDLAIAGQVARRIHQALAGTPANPPLPAPLTLSIGIGHAAAPSDLASLKSSAERHLRTAKQQGKARSIAG